MALRYLVPALAVAGRAAAQCSGTTTIQNQGDASALSTCQTYSGSIAIATGTSQDISIDGVRRITGSLIAKDVDQMSSLSGDSLQIIDDTFGLDNIQLLTTLNFPALTQVDTVEWTGLPNLQGLSLNAQIQQASTLSIQNTGLYSLEGIDLAEVDTVVISNNLDLTEISMKVNHISGSLSLQSNGRGLSVEFPNMEWTYNATFRNCSSVNMDSLAAVNGSLGFLSNYMEEISAPNLTSVGGTLGIISNSELTNISMPELKLLTGGLLIANNTNLETINGFPRLSQVMGNVDCSGDIKSVQLPKIDLVKGAFNLQSTKNLEETCNHFQSIAGPNEDIRGKFTCAGELDKPRGTGTLSPGTNAGAGGASGSAGAAVPLRVSGATGVIGVVAAIFGML